MSDRPSRRTVNLGQAMQIAGVTRRTLYRWLRAGKLEYLETPTGSPRIFEDSLLRLPRVRERHSFSASPPRNGVLGAGVSGMV